MNDDSDGQTAERRAIVDIGSNTVRLVIYGGPPRAPRILLNEKVTAKLGRELARSGNLSEKAMAAALGALRRFRALLDLTGVTRVDAVATAAARDAGNGERFLAAVRETGFTPRLLSGEEEARVSAMGVIAAFPAARGTTADLGGGSLELTAVADGTTFDGISLPLGTLRVPALRETGSKFPARIAAMIEQAGWRGGKGEPLYLVGGSFRSFALSAMEARGWPIDDPHGFEIAPDDALAISKPIAQGTVAHAARISSSRLATLPDAAALLHALVRAIEPSCLVFSSWGLREGLLYDSLDADARADDPLLAGVRAFARAMHVPDGAAIALADWIAPADPDPADAHLRLAACELALASMHSEPNLRADQAMGWALRKRWIGLDARGRAMLAMAVLANTGASAVPDVFLRLADRGDLDRAIGWGLAMRLCRRLTAGCPVAVAASRIARADKRLILTIDDPFAALFSDAIAKDLRALAEWLGLSGEFGSATAPAAARQPISMA